MLFEKDEDLELQPKRTKTLLISIGIHVLLLIFLALNPNLLTSTPKRIIRIMGQDYDLSKEQLTELVVPPEALRPKPPAAADKPLVQPPFLSLNLSWRRHRRHHHRLRHRRLHRQ